MVRVLYAAAVVLLCNSWEADAAQCSARALTEAGWVCGACARGGYARFLAVPYAKQPLGELRFQPLQPAEPWQGCRDATKLGPICPQMDIFYGPMLRKAEMREDCIHANIYTPLKSLPQAGATAASNGTLLPVLVQIHGGGFCGGSGDPDFHGPEYMAGDVVVVTFNYRMGPFGFLSLNSSSVPGNAGLRDMVSLLRWVRRNARGFGGDPRAVTLSGQSVGSIAVWLLSLSKAAEGLFHRAILMSYSINFSTKPAYSQFLAQQFLGVLGINGTDPEEAHRRLIETPLDKIMYANDKLLNETGIALFGPVVESRHPGVEIILDDDPEVLQAQGRGKDIPFLVGYANAECETFRPRFEEVNILEKVKKNASLLLSPSALFATPPELVPNKANLISQRYFNGTPTFEKYLKMCTDFYFTYPGLRLARNRAANGGAPVYLYEFGYEAQFNVFKEALNLRYRGAAHSEDVTYVFRENHVLGNRSLCPGDRSMMETMTTYVKNFMRYGDPTNGTQDWPPVTKESYKYRVLYSPRLVSADMSARQRDILDFYDRIYEYL